MNKTHLHYYWWTYALVAAVSILVWTTAFSAKLSPEDNERLHILYVGENLNRYKLEQEVKEVLPALTNQKVQQVKVSQITVSGMQVYQVLDTRRYEYDIILISDGYLQENMGTALFRTAMTEAMQQMLSAYDLYAEGNGAGSAPCGVQLDQVKWKNFCITEEECYLFISPESVNFGGLNGKGRAEDDCGLRVMEYILKGGVTP